MSSYDFDLITIGAGSGGVRASRLASNYGAKVAIAEESRLGGTCVMRGCVPKKLLVQGSQFGAYMEDAKGFGWSITEARHDWGKMIAAKDRELDRIEGIFEGVMEKNNLHVLRGTGKLVAPHTVEVAGQTYTAERVLLAVGGWPTLPQVPGIEHAITSNEALDLEEMPKRIAVVGGGYIAVEFAGIFRSCGAEVTEIIRADKILRGFDEDVRDTLTESLQARGITIRNKSTVASIARLDDGSKVLTFDDGSTLEVDQVMYATGRAPKIDGLGLEDLGVALTSRGAVKVNERNETNLPWLFAVGDVTDRVNLTPVAIQEGQAFAETIYNNNPSYVDYENIASAVFSQPPVGTVGLSEQDAKARGPVTIYETKFRPLANAVSGRDERTYMKLVVDNITDRVIGVHMVGPDAPEIIQGVAIAVKCGATKNQFDATVPIHPTAAEEFVTLRTARPDPHEA
jgi:glutathione reductase (NADPH)